MKHSIICKFLAILLCAASLMGIVGGAAGALVLSEGNLYNRTVDEMLDEKLKDSATLFAEQTALAYAGKELGGCPEEMIQRYDVRPDCDYGYVILDAEGNVLESVNPHLKQNAQVYEIPVAGQYMHLVSTETDAQRLANETAARMDAISRGMADSDGETIPDGGIIVNQVIFTNKEGAPIYEATGDAHHSSTSTFYYSDPNNVHSSSYDHGPQQQIGFLYYDGNGQLMYRSFLEENEYNFPPTVVHGVLFVSHDQDGFIYQLDSPDSLGILCFENGYVRFLSDLEAEEAPEETVPATVPETLPDESTVSPTEATAVTEETQSGEETEATEETSEKEEGDSKDKDEKKASSASADPDEEPRFKGKNDIDWEYFDEKARERILYDWLLAGELIKKKEAPDDLIPDVDLHYWLTEYDYIDSDQVIPEIGIIPEETVPEETEPVETVPEETIPEETIIEETIPVETLPEVTEPVLINGKPLETYQVNRTEYVDQTTGGHTTAKFVYLPLPEMTVEVYMDRDTLGNAAVYDVLRLVRQYRQYLLPAIGICLLIFALSAVYLCTAAGRKPKTEEVRAGGINRLPLDLYLGIDLFLGSAIIVLAGIGVPMFLENDLLLGCAIVAAAAFAVCLLVTAYLFAFAAQCKTPGGFWWRNTLTVRFIFLFMRWAEKLRLWLAETGLPKLKQLLKKLWEQIIRLGAWGYHLWEKLAHWLVDSCFRRLGAKMVRFYSLLPLTWQWLLTGVLVILMLLIGCALEVQGAIIAFALFLALILYGAHCFGVLMESTRKMGQGDLDTKVDDKLMVGSFKDFAGDLNNLGDVAMVAAQKQLKSERMKTELITNVSHDIKTPLTSIINYVDLLQKPHTEEEGGVYLEVLERQSQRLKKLVDDLMDMSKASTGNMTVEITRLDAVESVNQALGEFADKLERAQLYPVFRHNESSAPIMADGRLVWRVLSNLLSNTVKYAMPGTRIYLDLSQVNGKVIISLKNISREELNIDAEELMERFVRGDVSRNTEGSGLGLNIAKSLMELQKGTLQLLVDGDLFKVTLIFPAAE